MSHSSVHGVAFHRPWCLIPRFHCQTWILYILWWNCKTTNRITITGFVYHLKSQKWHQIIIHKSKICVTRNVLTSRKMFIYQIRADPYISGINQPISKKISASRTELFKGLHVTWNFWKTLYFLSYDSLKLKIFDRKRTKFYAFSFSKEFFYQKTTLNLDETYTTKKLPRFAGLPRILRVNRQRRPCNLCHCARHVIHVIPVTCITWPLVNITPRSHVIVRVAWRHCKKSAVKMAEIVRPSWRFCFAKAPRAARA